jgi:hypothetical protein
MESTNGWILFLSSFVFFVKVCVINHDGFKKPSGVLSKNYKFILRNRNLTIIFSAVYCCVYSLAIDFSEIFLLASRQFFRQATQLTLRHNAEILEKM